MTTSAPPQVVFSTDVKHMDEWARRSGIPLTASAEELNTYYARAHRWLLFLKRQLVQDHGWNDIDPPEPRMLFSIELPTPYRSSSGLPRSPNMRLQLPANASSFFSPDRRVQWQMVFHSALFPAMRHTVPPVADILHLLQCLLTGMLVLVKEEQDPRDGLCRIIRGLPPADWVTSNEGRLREIFGDEHYRKLFRAAGDKRRSFKLEQELPLP